MGQNRTDKVLIKASFPEIAGSVLTVLLGVLLIVEVMEQANHAPVFHIFAIELGKVTHCGLNRDCMVDQRLCMGVCLEKFQRCCAVHGKCHCNQSSDFY